MKYLKLIRIKQWVKNLFLFAPLVFSQHLFELDYVEKAIIGLVCFCLTSSVVYIINDIADRESDRNHPVKKLRPIPSGAISIQTALIIAISFFVVVIFLSQLASVKFQIALLTYLLVNLLYSFKLKNIVLLDVFLIAFGFMIRIVAGAWIINVEISNWLILTTLFLSLFLGITKRRSEIQTVENTQSNSTRKVLDDYSIEFADQLATIVASGTVISYALYTVSQRTINIFHTENLIFTTPFVVFGIFRYLFLVHKRNLGENPTYIITTDIPMIINILLWLLASIVIIYKSKLGM